MSDRDRFPVVVHVLLVRDASIFLLRRSRTGFMDGFYVLPGGYQQAGESVSAAAQRECLEETGATPAQLVPLCVVPYRSGRHRGLNFVFEARKWAGEPSVAEPALFDRAGWYDLAALPAPCAPWIADVLELRGRGVWYRELDWNS